MKLNSKNNWMVEFKSLHKGAVEPQQTDDYSIGYDLVVPTDVHIPAHSRFYVPLGFAIGLPKHIEGKIEPRSGFSGKGIEGIGKKWGVEAPLWFPPCLLPTQRQLSFRLRRDSRQDRSRLQGRGESNS